MKKLVSFVMAAVLCVGMTTSVLAAPSASYTPENGVTVDGTKGDVDSVEEIGTVDADKVEDGLAQIEEEHKEVLAVSAFGIQLKADVKKASLTFSITGAKWGDVWVVYKWQASENARAAGEWVKTNINIAAGNGIVVADITESGEYMFVKTAAGNGVEPNWGAVSGNTSNDAATGSTAATGTSPKTADAGMYIVMLAVVALAGTVVATRKVKINR